MQRAVALLDGVSYASYNFSTSILKVAHNINNETIMSTVQQMGYKVIHRKSARESLSFKPFYKEPKAIVTGIASLFWLAGIIANFAGSAENLKNILLFIGLAFGVIYPAKAAFMALKNKMALDMNVLMVVAVVGAVYLGEYFEATTVTVLFSIGKMLETYSMDKTRQSIRSLMSLAPPTAIVKRNGIEQEIAVEDVVVNDIVVIKPGMKIGIDGEVVEGYSSVNQAPITGESMPVAKDIGDGVYAGTINEEGYLEVKVTKCVGDTTLDQIIELVEEAQAQRAPSQQFVDVFAKYYTPAVILIALGIVTIPPLFFNADLSKWLYSGISLLVVSCPCALVISTPVSIVSAIGNAARNGVLIKGGAYLEQIGKLNAIALDKTGTLTKGEPKVTRVISYSSFSENEVTQLAATVESVSQHPLATAIIKHAKLSNVNLLELKDFQSLTGRGVQAIVNGKLCVVCKPDYAIQELKINISNKQKQINDLQQQGNTVMFVAYNNELAGIIAVADIIRENSIETINKLTDVGIKNIIMLTGDNEKTAKSIAKKLNIKEFKANLLPDEKVKAVTELMSKYDKVAMVGDGVNDAPALATSSVGIAMGGAGTDTALETADVVLMGDDLTKVSYTMLLGRKTLNIIKQNIYFSLIVKLIAILLVFPGWLTLWIAILADTGAALIVILNGMRLLRVKKM